MLLGALDGSVPSVSIVLAGLSVLAVGTRLTGMTILSRAVAVVGPNSRI